MKQITKLLNSADDALESTRIKNGAGEIEEVIKGYVSGFGPSVINSGLIPAMAFYISDKKKKVVIEAIAATLNIPNANNAKELFLHCNAQSSNKNALAVLREKIINASVALKLMMRTYKFVEPKNEEVI
jgi:CRISPR-associated protein Cmr5